MKSIKSTVTIASVILAGLMFGVQSYLALALRSVLEDEFGIDNANHFTGVFSYGVILGIVIILTTTKLNHKYLTVAMLGLSVVGTLGACVFTDFSVIIICRIISALGFAPFFASGGYLVIDILGKGKEGQAMAMPVIGLNLAGLTLVPLLSQMGIEFGSYRAPYFVVAAVGAVCMILIAAFAPSHKNEVPVSIAKELSVFKSFGLWCYTILGFLVFTIYLEIYRNIRGIMGQVLQIDTAYYSLVLFGIGVACVIGSQIGGMLADRDPARAIWLPVAGISVAIILMFAFAGNIYVCLAAMFLLGITVQSICSPIVVHSMRVAPQGPMMSASMFQVGACTAVFCATYLDAAVGGYLSPYTGNTAISAIWLAAFIIPLMLAFAFLSLRKGKIVNS